MDQMMKSAQIISDLIKDHASARQFAIKINAENADVIRWRQGKVKVGPRAVVNIARLFDVKPFDLRPDLFPENLKFMFE